MTIFSKIFSLLMILIIAMLLASCGSSVPSDALIRGSFEANEAKYVRLKEMISSETKMKAIGVGKIDEYSLYKGKWIKPDYEISHTYQEFTQEQVLLNSGLTLEKHQEYLLLLQSTRVNELFKQTDNDTIAVFFELGCSGSVTSDSVCKFIVYRSEPPSPLVINTDLENLQQNHNDKFCYAKLADGWYIQRSWWK